MAMLIIMAYRQIRIVSAVIIIIQNGKHTNNDNETDNSDKTIEIKKRIGR